MTMTRDEMQVLQDQFDAEVKEMDAEAASWDASRRAEYEAERDNIRGVLSVWGDKAEAEWDQFKVNIEQGWHALRAKWHSTDTDGESEESGNLTDDLDDAGSHA